MASATGRDGPFLISWSQTDIDGHAGAPEAALGIGSLWRWHGAAIGLGAALGGGERQLASCHKDARQGEAHAARQIVGRALGRNDAGRPGAERTFTVTDGHARWTATMIDLPELRDPLLVFAGAMPPADVPLRVDWVETLPVPLGGEGVEAVVCFTPGTWIETRRGARQIEHLSAGDRVMTADSGPQEIVWIGRRHLTREDLWEMPELQPVRIRGGALGQVRAEGDLVVSPDHRMVVRPKRSGGAEIMVSARDLIDGDAVMQETPPDGVTYLHLLFERHHVILANGFLTESFHPGTTSLAGIPGAERERLFDVMPLLALEPGTYGPTARPVLSRAEAALLTAA